MTLLVLIFGLLSGCLLAVLVGLLGARRRIGFGWSFFLSVLFSPLVGLICTLLSDPLSEGERRWGCLGGLLGFLGLLLLLLLLLLFFLGGAAVATV